IRPAPRNFVQVESRLVNFFSLRKLDPVQKIHRQHARRGKVRMASGDSHGRVAGKQMGELLQVALLAPEIQLALQHTLKLSHRGLRAVMREFRYTLSPMCQAGQDIQIAADDFLDPMMPDLYDDPIAIV